MKYIELFENNSFFGKKETKECIAKYKIRNYTLSNGKFHIEGNVSLCGQRLRSFPIKFGNVYGSFDISYNQIKSLENLHCPSYVVRDFSCQCNRLTSLLGGPKIVNQSYTCDSNELITLKGAPKEVYYFACNNNKLTNLKYLPIASGYNIRSNPLPKEILNLNSDQLKLLAKNQNDYGIWNSRGIFNEWRWEEFKKDLL